MESPVHRESSTERVQYIESAVGSESSTWKVSMWIVRYIESPVHREYST